MQNEINPFENWLSEKGQDLWKILHHPVSGQEDHSEDFLKVLSVSRRRIEKIFGNNGSAQDATKVFLRNWIKRQDNPAGWESRLVVLGLFYLKWSTEDVSRVLAISAPTLKFRAVRELKKLHYGEDEGPAPIDRNCVRFDLYYADLLLGIDWIDPLRLVRKSELIKHAENCPRCHAVDQELRTEVSALQSAGVGREWADRDRELLLRESTGTRRVLSFEWFDAMPWFVKTPLQMGLVTAAIMIALSIPYVGDLFPGLNLHERFESVWHDVGPNKPLATLALAPDKTRDRSLTPDQASHLETTLPAEMTTRELPMSLPLNAAKVVTPVVKAPPAIVATVKEPTSREPLENPDPPFLDARKTNWKIAGLSAADIEKRHAPVVIVAEKPAATAVTTTPAKTGAPTAIAENSATKPLEKVVPPGGNPPAKVAATTVESKPTVVAAPPPTEVASEDKGSDSSNDLVSGDDALEDPTSIGVGEKVFFRWGAFSRNIDEDNAKILQILTKYGASVAGEIPLGGQYLHGRYFHFTIARDDFSAMLREVKALDLIGLTNAKATSNRVTPAQKRRVVFLVRPQ